MNIKKLRINRKVNHDEYEVLHPETSISQVVDLESGKTLAEILAEILTGTFVDLKISNHINNSATKHIEVLDATPTELNKRGILFIKTGIRGDIIPRTEEIEEILIDGGVFTSLYTGNAIDGGNFNLPFNEETIDGGEF